MFCRILINGINTFTFATSLAEFFRGRFFLSSEDCNSDLEADASLADNELLLPLDDLLASELLELLL